MHRLRYAAALGVLSLTLSPLAAAESVSEGAVLSASCAGCHGTDGHSPGAIPSIAGKSAQFIERALKEFRAGTRPATVMDRHAQGYTDEQIALIARYFAAR